MLPTSSGLYVISIYSSVRWRPTCFPKHLHWLCIAFSHGWYSNGGWDAGTEGSLSLAVRGSEAPMLPRSQVQAQVWHEEKHVYCLCALELKKAQWSCIGKGMYMNRQDEREIYWVSSRGNLFLSDIDLNSQNVFSTLKNTLRIKKYIMYLFTLVGFLCFASVSARFLCI